MCHKGWGDTTRCWCWKVMCQALCLVLGPTCLCNQHTYPSSSSNIRPTCLFAFWTIIKKGHWIAHVILRAVHFNCRLVFWLLWLHAAECRLAPQWRCTVLFWTWNALWMEVKAEVVETALALLPLTLFILYVTFSGRGEGCCQGLCNRSSRSCSTAQAALWGHLVPPAAFFQQLKYFFFFSKT